MNAKVIRTYRDKETRKIQKKGQKVELTKKRFEEINSTPYGVFLKEIKEPLKKATKKATPKKAKK